MARRCVRRADPETADADGRLPRTALYVAVMGSEIEAAFARLYAAELERASAIADLKRLGVIRSKVLVGDLGELVAANFYGVELAPVFTEGYDLIRRDGLRVQVKGMRGDEGKRTIVCRQRLPETCDLLFAIRFADDYTPLEAIEVPRAVADEMYGDRGVHWTRRLVAYPTVRSIGGSQLSLAALITPVAETERRATLGE